MKSRWWFAACASVGFLDTAQPAAPDAEAAFDRLVRVCGELPAPGERVACFDREIAPFRPRATASAPAPAPATTPAPRAAAPAPPAPAVATALAPPARTPELGAEELKRPSNRTKQAEEAALTARITAIRVVDATASLVTLDNGQVWRNEDPRRSGYLTEGASVTIRKGSFGSYRLTLDDGDSRNWITVSRVR